MAALRIQDSADDAVARRYGCTASLQLSRLRPATAPVAHTAARGLMGPKLVFIADDHHRDEAVLQDRDELTRPDTPADFARMMLVGMSDPGLAIRPTHRWVPGSPGLNGDRLAATSDPELGGGEAGRGQAGCREARGRIQAASGQDVQEFGASADGSGLVAHLRSDATMDRLVPDRSPGGAHRASASCTSWTSRR
jgi:hypothetical protein